MKFLPEYEAQSDEAAQQSEHGQAAWKVGAVATSPKGRTNSEPGKERPKRSAGMAPKHLKPLLFFSLLILLTACQKEDLPINWTALNSNTSYDLQDVSFVDTEIGYAVGGARWTYGTLLKTIDGGTTWTNDSISNTEINALSSFDASEAYAVGFNNVFLTNKGTPYWQYYRLSNWYPLNGVAFHENGTGVAVGGGSYLYGIIYRFDENLNIDTLPLLEHELMDVCFTDANTLHAVGYGLVLKSVDAGETWTPNTIGGDFFQAVSFPSKDIGYAVGLQGSIIKTEDAGENWETLRNSNRLTVKRHKFRDVHFVNEEVGYIVGHEGLFWKTVDGGAEWKIVEGIPDVDFHAIEIIDNTGYIVGKEGTILKFSD